MSISDHNSKTPKESNFDFLRRVSQAYKQVLEQAEQIVVGQQAVFEGLVTSLTSGGHCLLEGGPGMAKTTILNTLAKLFGLEFRRISLTPDMTPHDIVLLEVETQQNKEDAYFANVLLVEEINCAQPKTQMALLNAIQDEHMTLGQTRFPLPKPFFVVATETLIEQDHISKLTASQLDRFMMKLVAGYPTFQEEFELVRRMATFPEYVITPVFTKEDMLRLQELVPRTHISNEVAEFAVNMIRKTRVEDPGETFEFMPQQVARGTGTSSLRALIRAAQARAVLCGRSKTAKNDIRFVSKLVLRHRLVMQPNASLSSDDVIEQLD